MISRKIKVHQGQLYIKFNMKPSVSKELQTKLEDIPLGLLSIRTTPYNIVDKSTNINYEISTPQQNQISLKFTKDDIKKCDFELLILSLDRKIQSQLVNTIKFLSYDKQKFKKDSYYFIKQIQYSPTEIIIEIQFGQIMISKFQFSYIIGNFLTDSNDRYIKFAILQNIIENTKVNYFLETPLNLTLLLQQTNIFNFSQLLYRTFIPMQILSQTLNDYLNLQIYNLFIYFYPTVNFGVFQFCIKKDNNEVYHQLFGFNQIIIQITSLYKDQELFLEIEDAECYAQINKIKSRLDYNDFIYHFAFLFEQRMVKLIQVENYFKILISINIICFMFYQSIEFIINQIKRYSFDQFYQKAYGYLVQKMGTYINLYYAKVKIQSNYELHIVQQLFALIKDRLIYSTLIFRLGLEERSVSLKALIKLYIDSLEKSIFTAFRDSNYTNLIEKLNNCWFVLGKENQYSIIIRLQGTIEYRICENQIIKIIDGQTRNIQSFDEFMKEEDFQKLISCFP